MTEGAAVPSRRRGASRDVLRHRRQQAILTTAFGIVTAEGHDALTMHRIATELECGVASVYRLFASKDALIAELLHQALDVLHASWLLGAAHLDDAVAGRGDDDQQAALTGAVGAAWFWVVADDRYGPQIDLSRRLFIDRRIVVPDEQAARVIPAVLRLMDHGRSRLDAAVDAGAIRPGNGVERAVLTIASLTGVLLTAKFGRWDQALFDGRALARQAVRDDFLGWGADPEQLDIAFETVGSVADAGRLAPPVEGAAAAAS